LRARIYVDNVTPPDDRYATFPPGFFSRTDDTVDTRFYSQPRLVMHIDDGAVNAISDLYDELGLHEGHVLDLMSSWVSHFRTAPKQLTVLGMNEFELSRNPQATAIVVHDLNIDPALPLEGASVDHVTCVVSIDYLTRPIEVLADAARVVRPGGHIVITFSNRCFPTKAIHGWLHTDDETHCAIVSTYLQRAGGWADITAQRRPTPRGADPLYAVTARRVPAQ
jgi:SAM-dependent methyltransferase